MRAKTVIIVNDSPFLNGGTASVALAEAKNLSRYGYEVIYFTAGRELSNDEIGGSFKHVTTDQLDVYHEPNFIRAFLRGIWNFKSYKALTKLLDNKKNNSNIVIHLYGWTKALSSSVVRAAASRNIPIVCSLFDYLIPCPNGAFYNFQKKRNCTLKPLSFACVTENCDSKSYHRKLWRVLRHFVQKYIGKIPGGINYFIGCSDLSVSIIKPFIPEKSKIHFIRNPISISKTDLVKVAKNELFIYIGRLSAEKGPLLFAEAAKKIGVKAIFIGDGDLRKNLEDLYPKFTVTGWIDRDEVSEYMRSARALVFPSLWTEVQGLVVHEAASMGIPAVVPDLAATREMVDHEISGLWFKSGDVFDLSKQISRMMDGDYASLLGINAYNNFWNNPPTINSYIADLNTLYASIYSVNSTLNRSYK